MFGILSGGVSVACWFLPYVTMVKLVTLTGGFTPILVIVAGCLALSQGYKPARYFLLAWLALLIGM